ncbi:dicer-like protein 4, partial [Quercus suber]
MCRELCLSVGAPKKGRSKSQLYEICAANYWKPPLFECCKEEGPSHAKMFTYKVIVEIKEASTTVLECFGAPRLRKKEAAEHAAEGALWYLKHIGFSQRTIRLAPDMCAPCPFPL